MMLLKIMIPDRNVVGLDLALPRQILPGYKTTVNNTYDMKFLNNITTNQIWLG
jgi:hypothetical protein